MAIGAARREEPKMTITDIIADNWDDLSTRAQAWARRTHRVDLTQWQVTEEGYHYTTIAAPDIDAALDWARAQVDRANYPHGDSLDDDASDRTIYVNVSVINPVTGETASDTVDLDPAEPDCDAGHDHDWCSPHDLLGGLAENPGVQGHGGGVIITEVCSHCGVYRSTDTWARRRDTGEQGLREVSYRPADDASLAWAAEQIIDAGSERRE
jgi:hypothetical protein